MKMKTAHRVGIACIAILIGTGTGSMMAHHAFSAEFDAGKPITLKATLSKVEWVNPHGWLHITVMEPDGKVTKWMGELGAPNALIRSGWSRDTLQIGMELVLEGFRSKDGTNKMTAMSVLLPNGQKLFSGSRGIGAPEPPAK